MKLNYILLADSAFTTEGTKTLNIIGMFDRIGAKKFPTIHPKFTVITEIQGEKGTHKQSIIIENKNGKEISRVDGQSLITTPEGKARFLGNFLMVQFESPGTYLINVLINEKKLGQLEFGVEIN